MTRPSGGVVDSIRRAHSMPFGAQWAPGLGTRFRLWAPAVAEAKLLIDEQGPRAMSPLSDGWHELVVQEARPGTRYSFGLPGGARVPDPASRFQPDDVHGPSEVIDPAAYGWSDGDWAGRPWHEAVVYELHLGAFTPEGTFKAATGKLDHLVGLGVNAVEIMPVADFPGRRNWGYDGVLPYAPDASYGRPEDFKAFIDAAHARSISVILDVVYNHFGPDGNYLSSYAPDFFTERHKTPWGAAINYDGRHRRAVRDFAIHNALYWIEEFHLDGLRLDAVHAIIDDSKPDLLQELVKRVRAATSDRPCHLILENEDNVASRLVRSDRGRPERYTAQWNDDVHHVLHVAASGEDKGYYADYLGDTAKLGRALAEGFAFQGEVMPYRNRQRGEPSASLPPDAFVAFIQNHDQIGNRAFGDRINTFAPPEAVRAIAATYLLLPQIPMLFMGEEWASCRPFPFFCDFRGELADAVRQGRREEFARFPEFRDPAMRERIPDPLADATFASARLDWEKADAEPHRSALAWYRNMLAIRRHRIAPIVAGIGHAGSRTVIGRSAVGVRWRAEGGMELVLAANLKAAAQTGFPTAKGDLLWLEGEAVDDRLGPWTVRWSIEEGTSK